MVLSCTSCGDHIKTVTKVYKCRQCVHHVVCNPCYKVEHSRLSARHHPLYRVDPVALVAASDTMGSASSSSTAMVPSSSTVLVKSNSGMFLPSSSKVYASANPTVYASANPTVYASASPAVLMKSSSGTFLPSSSAVYAPASSTAYAPASSTAYAPASSTAYAPASSTIYASAHPTVYAPASSAVYAPESSTVYASANPTAYASASSTVFAPSGSTVLLPQPSTAVVTRYRTRSCDRGCSKETTTPLFTSRDYLTKFLGYCNHCLKVIVGGRDDFYSCDQCSGGSYDVCKQCVPLMPTVHHGTHTFSKKITSTELLQLSHNLNHLHAKCGGCARPHFRGIRYRCKRRDADCDFCEQCTEKTYKQLPLRIVPHPFLLANNKYLLAKRAMQVIDVQHAVRDPLTGWTRASAETIVEKAVRDQVAYRNQLATILATRELYGNGETDLTWREAKVGLDTIRELGDRHIVVQPESHFY